MRKLHRDLAVWTVLAWGGAACGCAAGPDRSSHEPPSAHFSRAVGGVATSEVVRGSSEEAAEEDTERGWQLSDFYPSQLGTTVKRLTGRGPNRGVAQRLYEEGESLYRQALVARSEKRDAEAQDLFLQAGDKFDEASDRWPDSALQEDALFYAGECLFYADRYANANAYLEQLVENYPNTRYLDLVGARRFVIADYWIKLHAAGAPSLLGLNLTDKQRPWTDTFGHAVRVYDRMRLDDPTGKLADDATIAAANSLFARGDYLRADQYYTDLRLHFPSSEHQFMAHYLGIQSKMRSYRGPEFTGQTLDETEKLIKQAQRQFPQQARQYEQELAKAYREVRYRKAEREWLMAQYYSQRREYAAARIYHDVILSDFSDTPFAEKSRAAVVQIADKPPSPTQKLSWLVDLFPDGKPPQPQMAELPGKPPQQQMAELPGDTQQR